MAFKLSYKDFFFWFSDEFMSNLKQIDIDRLHFQMAPCEVKELIGNIINKKRIIPIREIDLNSVNRTQGAFSYEYTTSGQRTFFLLSYKYVYDLYKYLKEYHLYEVIPENHPCHLYFDVEFKFSEHPEFNGDKLIQKLIDLVDEKLLMVFGRADYEVIDLEATTDIKFSRHIIFRSDTYMFYNYKHVGHFVKTEILTDPELSIIVDQAVYTKNRNFRCIWATKVANGTKHPLIPKDKTNWCPQISTFEYFLKTLIAYKPKDKIHLIGYPQIDDIKKPTNRHSPSSSKDNSSIVKDRRINPNFSIEDQVLKKAIQEGYVSKTKYIPDFDILCLNVEGNKYCGNIGRPHKSNHIYLVCKLSSGVVTQRCYDPDCRGYESSPTEIPDDLLLKLREKYHPTNSNHNITTFVPSKIKSSSLIEQIINENSQPPVSDYPNFL